MYARYRLPTSSGVSVCVRTNQHNVREGKEDEGEQWSRRVDRSRRSALVASRALLGDCKQHST